jgi:arginase
MAATFVVVPQWQGSGSSRAMRLVDGAEAIRGDLPSSSTRAVEVPLEAGDSQGTNVQRLSSIALVRDAVRDTLAGVSGPAIVIGGDCGVELGAVERVADDSAVLWFDAHPDLNTPESSPSGAFTGMVLRTLLGEGAPALVPTHPLPPHRVVLAGVRSMDPGEEDYLATAGIRVLAPGEVSPESVAAAITATGAARVYIHVDLDVLDPGEITGLGAPEPFGVMATTLVETIRGVLAGHELSGAGLTEFAPASPADAVDDMPTILRIIGALTRP